MTVKVVEVCTRVHPKVCSRGTTNIDHAYIKPNTNMIKKAVIGNLQRPALLILSMKKPPFNIFSLARFVLYY